MKTHLVSYATATFRSSQQRLETTAARYGVEVVHGYGRADLCSTSFYQQYRPMLDQGRGGGYWLWKPFWILQTLQTVSEGDIVLYADAGVEVVRPLAPLFKLCQEGDGLLFFRGMDPARMWTKRDCFVLLGCDVPEYWESISSNVTTILFRKNARSLAFVTEWMEACKDPRMLTDMPNSCGRENLPGFVDHRHDSSLFSLLAHRFQAELYRTPSQWGNHEKTSEFREAGEFLARPYAGAGMANSPYPTLFAHNPSTLRRVWQRLNYLPALLRGDEGIRRALQQSLANRLRRSK